MRETIVRTALLILALTNQILSACGVDTLPIAEGELEEVLNTVLTGLAALWAWWKNNSFTKEARTADALMHKLKEEKQ
ncbi:MAG: phage holin [Oscillospiraceae bacterium]|nr:phage holin [Oscillospiraceae bacterium]